MHAEFITVTIATLHIFPPTPSDVMIDMNVAPNGTVESQQLVHRHSQADIHKYQNMSQEATSHKDLLLTVDAVC